MRNRATLANQPAATLHSTFSTITLLAAAPTHTSTTQRDDLRSSLHIRPTPPSSKLISENGTSMAIRQNKKRQRVDETSRADAGPPAKKAKTRSEAELEAWDSWEYDPEFYDGLSEIVLTRRALKELNRRTRSRRSHPSPPAQPIANALASIRSPRKLAQFARLGGPDLRDLRGVRCDELSLEIIVLTSPCSTHTHQPIVPTLST